MIRTALLSLAIAGLAFGCGEKDDDKQDPAAAKTAPAEATPKADPPATPAADPAAASEGEAGLDCWLDAMLGLVRPKGRVTLIHRADRLGDVLAGLRGRAGATVVFPLWPRAGEAAKRIIVTARRGIATPLRLAAGLVLHAGGSFTPAAEAVLRHAAALDLD